MRYVILFLLVVAAVAGGWLGWRAGLERGRRDRPILRFAPKNAADASLGPLAASGPSWGGNLCGVREAARFQHIVSG